MDVCAYQRERLLDISTCTRELGGASLIYRICGIFDIPWCGVMVTSQRGDRGHNYIGFLRRYVVFHMVDVMNSVKVVRVVELLFTCYI